MTEVLETPADFRDLLRFSAHVGADPLLIQAAGGNTSVKEGDVMWIKASGTCLADAESSDIFLPVDLPAMRAGLANPEVDADQAAQFTLGGFALRPSIETSLHAVFAQRVVVHVHCVNTLAYVVQRNAEPLLHEKLSGFDWRFVPYTKPGANLAEQVRCRLGQKTNVVLLGNHGIIVAGETVAEASEVLSSVVAALTIAPEESAAVDVPALNNLISEGWRVPPATSMVHQLALDPRRLRKACGGSLYPDHVIFCGVGATEVTDTLPKASEAPVFLLIPGKGAVMRKDASESARALMNCLGNVLQRVPPEAEIKYLTLEENAELLDWDAEKYRQQLNA